MSVALSNVTQRQTSLQQRLLERERTADDKAHQVVPPLRSDVRRLIDQFAVAPHPVAWHIRANIHVVAQCWQQKLTGSVTANSGQGLGFSWQNAKKSVAQARGKITTLPCTC